MLKLKIDKIKIWLNTKGYKHRIDGPAVEDNNGTKIL